MTTFYLRGLSESLSSSIDNVPSFSGSKHRIYEPLIFLAPFIVRTNQRLSGSQQHRIRFLMVVAEHWEPPSLTECCSDRDSFIRNTFRDNDWLWVRIAYLKFREIKSATYLLSNICSNNYTKNYLKIPINVTDPPLVTRHQQFREFRLCREGSPAILHDWVHRTVEEWVMKARNVWNGQE